MRRFAVASVLILIVSGRIGLAQPSGYVEVNGKDSPSDVPEWLAWESAFRNISLLKSKGSRTILDQIGLSSEKDEELVLKEASEQRIRETECQRRMEKLGSEIAKDRPDVADRKVKAMQVECREQMIEARDRVLQGLSREGRTAIQAWVESNNSGIRVMVPRGQMAHFRSPQ